jgi:hypothetical protein
LQQVNFGFHFERRLGIREVYHVLCFGTQI